MLQGRPGLRLESGAGALWVVGGFELERGTRRLLALPVGDGRHDKASAPWHRALLGAARSCLRRSGSSRPFLWGKCPHCLEKGPGAGSGSPPPCHPGDCAPVTLRGSEGDVCISCSCSNTSRHTSCLKTTQTCDPSHWGLSPKWLSPGSRQGVSGAGSFWRLLGASASSLFSFQRHPHSLAQAPLTPASASFAPSACSCSETPPPSSPYVSPDAIGPTRIIQGRLLVSAPFTLITSAKSLFTRQGTHSQAPATRAWPRVVPVRETVTWELGALGPPGAGPQALGFLSALPITILSLPLGPPSLPLEAHRRLMQGPPSLHTGAGTPQVRGPAPVARLEHCGWGQACRRCCPQRPPGHSGMGTLCQAPQWPLWATWALHPGGAGSGGNRAGGQGAAWGGARRREKGEGGARRG